MRHNEYLARASVLYGLQTGKEEGAENAKLVWTFPSAEVKPATHRSNAKRIRVVCRWLNHSKNFQLSVL